MKKLFLSLLMALTFALGAMAMNPPDEGMWLPMLIERLNYVDMQKKGLHLTAEELYSVNHSSLKDAIVGLGNADYGDMHFCTAEAVSDQGLLLTNHHCGFDAIQEQSSVEHDYLTNGFWAYKMDEELPCTGVTACFLVRMEDVTATVLAGVTENMDAEDRASAVKKASQKLIKENNESGKYKVTVKGFYEDNEYYMFVYNIYRDVRLVGAPPSSIGKFGGDTDNWMWPRHTGDFSMLRVYAGADGNPADYSKDNIPMKPKHHLPVSLKGVKKNDFAMIWGYPGTTDRFLTSYGVDLAVEQSNPTVVKIRTEKLGIIKDAMNADPKVKIQYASKYASSANYWKYFIGQTAQLQRNGVYEKKKQIEDAFTAWVKEDATRQEKYGKVLPMIESGYNELKQFNISLKYLEEAVFQGPEFIYFSFGAYSLFGKLKSQADTKDKTTKAAYVEDIRALSAELKKEGEKHFKNYNTALDKKLFISLMKMYYTDVPKDQHPSIFADVDKKYKGSFEAWANAVYSKSIFVDEARMNAFLDNPTYKVLSADPGWLITMSMVENIQGIYGKAGAVEDKINLGSRLFVQGLREKDPNYKWYPNANSTMRMTYGQVMDYKAADAVYYDFQTTLQGLIQKEDPKNDEFIVPAKLKDLYASKDYGPYGQDGKMPVCFIANLDITGGNSGSPVINGDGQLIGIAFDGNWEAMSGDIYYEPEVQRTICVDIRYVLFVIDKYAGAKNLIDEMTIIQ